MSLLTALGWDDAHDRLELTDAELRAYASLVAHEEPKDHLGIDLEPGEVPTEEDIDQEAALQYYFLKGGGNTSSPRHPLYRGPANPVPRQAELRRWARDRGLEVNAQGRLPDRIGRLWLAEQQQDAH
jgi:hypothetical protein